MSTIKLRFKQLDDATLLRMLVTHPMETGRRRDPATGALVPAHYIQTLRIEHNGRAVVDCQFSTAVSRDPYLSVRLLDARSGDRVRVSWVDNLGASDRAESTIP
jgi:sulfur-oxidizing protein SoxZ